MNMETILYFLRKLMIPSMQLNNDVSFKLDTVKWQIRWVVLKFFFFGFKNYCAIVELNKCTERWLYKNKSSVQFLKLWRKKNLKETHEKKRFSQKKSIIEISHRTHNALKNYSSNGNFPAYVGRPHIQSYNFGVCAEILINSLLYDFFPPTVPAQFFCHISIIE